MARLWGFPLPFSPPFLLLLLAFSSLVPVVAPAGASGEPNVSDALVIEDDTAIYDADFVADGGLVIRSGATLRLGGSTLRMGRTLVVEPGASLILEASGPVGSTLLPADQEEGFWIDVRGALESHGPASHTIEGLRGDLGKALFEAEGGLQVAGVADLESIAIRDSQIGVFVPMTGVLRMRDASLEGLGEIGIAAAGQVSLDRVAIRNHSLMAISGRDACNIRVANSTIERATDGIVLNSCVGAVEGSEFHDVKVPITATAAAVLHLQDSVLAGYTVDGIAVKPRPDVAAPQLFLTNVTFRPARGADRAMELMGVGTAVLDRVTVEGHAGYGIQASTSNLTISNSTIRANGKYGIFAVGGSLRVDLSTMDFGGTSTGPRNRLGAIRHVALFSVLAVDGGGRPVDGLTIEVFGSDAHQPVFEGNATQGPVQVQFEAYGGAGSATYAGPFTYRATLSGSGREFAGPLENLGRTLILQVPDEGDGQGPVFVLLALLGAAALFHKELQRGLLRAWRALRGLRASRKDSRPSGREPPPVLAEAADREPDPRDANAPAS